MLFRSGWPPPPPGPPPGSYPGEKKKFSYSLSPFPVLPVIPTPEGRHMSEYYIAAWEKMQADRHKPPQFCSKNPAANLLQGFCTMPVFVQTMGQGLSDAPHPDYAFSDTGNCHSQNRAENHLHSNPKHCVGQAIGTEPGRNPPTQHSCQDCVDNQNV